MNDEPESRVGLRTVGLTKSFGGITAVDQADVQFKHSKVNAVIGPNGSGKTTFLNVVTGMIKPDSGQVYYEGRDITGRSADKIARAGIGRSFQLCRVFPRLTVLENVLVATRPSGLDYLRTGHRKELVDKARSILHKVGIEHLEKSEARNISYGQQKLLELAGVLMADPETIVLDEPAGGVNPALIERLALLIKELNEQGRTFLIVEHNMDFVMSLSDHVIVFDRGRPIAEGPPSIIQTDSLVLEAYLGV